MTTKEMRAERRKRGVCPNCGVLPAADGRVRCGRCLEAEQQRQGRRADAKLLSACVVALRAWVQAGESIEALGQGQHPKVVRARQLTGAAVDLGLLTYGRPKRESRE